MRTQVLAAVAYLLLFIPPALFFRDEGLPQPYFAIVATLILLSSWAVGRIIGTFSALALPLIPWVTALVLIATAPEDDLGEVTRHGSMILWSVVFLFITSVVLTGVLTARRGSGTKRTQLP